MLWLWKYSEITALQDWRPLQLSLCESFWLLISNLKKRVTWTNFDYPSYPGMWLELYNPCFSCPACVCSNLVVVLFPSRPNYISVEWKSLETQILFFKKPIQSCTSQASQHCQYNSRFWEFLFCWLCKVIEFTVKEISNKKLWMSCSGCIVLISGRWM